MKLGVRLHDLGKGTASEMAAKAKAIGFDGVQLVMNKAILNETGLPGTLNKQKASRIARNFKEQGLDIFMLGAYFNPVHSNSDFVLACMAKFKEHLEFANDFGCAYVGSETGSYNDDKWTYNPLNRTPEAMVRVKTVFGNLAKHAAIYNTNIALEGAYGHCAYEPKVLKEIVDSIDNGHIFITVDLYNYLAISNYKQQRSIFDECIATFKDKIVIFHIKDFVVEGETLKQVGLGQGIMDFDYILPIIKTNCPNAYLIFEGVKEQDMQSSFDFISAKLKEE